MIAITSSTCIEWQSSSDSTRTEQGVGVLCINGIKGVPNKMSVAGNPVSINIELEDIGGEKVDRVLQII